jgi:hypothetical protein
MEVEAEVRTLILLAKTAAMRIELRIKISLKGVRLRMSLQEV